MTKIDTTKLRDITLQVGAGQGDSLCVMQAIAIITGDAATIMHGTKPTDLPSCVDPLLRIFGICLNDRLLDPHRQTLKQRIPRFIDTINDGLYDQRRFLLIDFIIHERLPHLLTAAGVPPHLRPDVMALPAVTDNATMVAACSAVFRMADNTSFATTLFPAWINCIHSLRRAVSFEANSLASSAFAGIGLFLDEAQTVTFMTLLDRLLALSDTPLDQLTVGDLVAAPAQADALTSGTTPFPDAAPRVEYTPVHAPGATSSFVGQAY